MPNTKRFSPETIAALEKERVRLFVHFDFEFFPMRVHAGEGTIEWDGHRWEGVGDVLGINSFSSTSSTSVLTSRLSDSHDRVHMAASLPMDKEMKEVLTGGYFKGRGMEWLGCSLRGDGSVIERIYYNKGTMVECSLKEDILTFKAESALFDSIDEKDARRGKRAAAFRKQFKEEMMGRVASGGMGWLMNLLSPGPGLALDILKMCIPGRAHRAARQRWQARKRVFWCRTEPKIPGMKLGKEGYKIRADTLDEATRKISACAARRIWDFPRAWIQMLVYVNDKHVGMIDLDSIRRRDDPKRWEELVRPWS